MGRELNYCRVDLCMYAVFQTNKINHVVEKLHHSNKKKKMTKLLESSNVFSFYCSHKHNNGQPIWFTLGILEALKGWDQGLKGMCVGEKRKLIIPPALGYGKEGKGNKNYTFLLQHYNSSLD